MSTYTRKTTDFECHAISPNGETMNLMLSYLITGSKPMIKEFVVEVRGEYTANPEMGIIKKHDASYIEKLQPFTFEVEGRKYLLVRQGYAEQPQTFSTKEVLKAIKAKMEDDYPPF